MNVKKKLNRLKINNYNYFNMDIEREKDIQTICEHIKNSYVQSTGDYGPGGQCPYCLQPCSWDAGSVLNISHKPDCIVLIAKDLSTNNKNINK